jgi:uncharacterized protein (DUF779 family)
MHKRVDVTDEARRVIDQLREAHGPLMFHQSGGCCDGSSPMCFQDGEFRVGASDILIGEMGKFMVVFSTFPGGSSSIGRTRT